MEVLEEKEANIGEAKKRTIEAEKAIKQVDDLLIHTLSIDDTVDWESLKKFDDFEKVKKKAHKKILRRNSF